MSREEQYESVLNHLKKRGVSEDYPAFLETQTIFNENKPYKGYIIFKDYQFILHITIPENILIPIYAVTTSMS